MYCATEGCLKSAVGTYKFCQSHLPPNLQSQVLEARVIISDLTAGFGIPGEPTVTYTQKPSLAVLYPKYYKAVPKGWEFLDTYAVNILFPVVDPSGCILHARKKLLVPGVRSGGKSMRKDISEARDTLNRWLELNPE